LCFEHLGLLLLEILKLKKMQHLERITFNPQVMGGKTCIRGMRVTVGAVVSLVGSGHSFDEILKAYPYLELEDIQQCLRFSAIS
jgi:uncharacterized protein (DUF433 family)